MNFTFGIITTKSESEIYDVLVSIEKQNIPNYEIIVVGGNGVFKNPNIIHIPFDESVKNNWITRKKNIISKTANFENIVFLHDYFLLSNNWYYGQLSCGNDFKIRVDKIINKDGSRFRDWCLWPDNKIDDNTSTENIIREYALLPYDVNNLNCFQYISGGYWVAKKSVMIEYPLDETLCWGQSEDVEWSKRVRKNNKITMNLNSSVYLNKYKSVVFKETTDKILKTLFNLL